ncbi:MAG: AzlD domain-containing protein [Clostridia bacterium]|nr:AzlD domain-containing protein [Clostridia bacterium]
MQYFIIILLMALVTYIPRLIPLTVLRNKKLPPFWNRFLRLVPFAILSALIFPQVLYSTNNVISALVGVIIAITCAFLRMNITVVVFAAILGVFICNIV